MVRFVRRAAVVVGVVAAPALGQYVDDASVNTPVGVRPGDQTVVKSATAADGSTWIGWWESSSSGFDIYVQLLDRYGVAQLAPGGMLASDALQPSSLVDWDLGVDADGNCMLAFTDARAGSDRDVAAQLVSPAGALLWGAGGVVISVNDDFEADPRIAQDTVSGEYYVVWPRFDSAPGLYLQRLDALGAAQLAAGGVKIAGTGSEAPAFAEIEATAGGGFVASWVRDTATFFSSRHVHAQSFDAVGAARWATDPTVVSDAASVPIAHRPRLVVDGSGGCAIAWHDTRTGVFDAWAQRYDAAGTAQFAADGAQCSLRAGRQQLDPAVSFIDGTSDLMVFFNDRDQATQSVRGIGVQRLGAAGARVFGDAAIEVTAFEPVAYGAPRSRPASGGGMAIYVRDTSPSGTTDGDIRAARVDGAGGVVWSADVSTPASSKSRVNLSQDGQGALYVAWADSRNDAGDVYAQRVDAEGDLGAPRCPGDANGDLEVGFTDLNILLSEFGMTGPGLQADFEPDEDVDFFDLNVLLSAFGDPCE